MDAKTCNSCKKKTVNDRGTVTFKCPKCSQYEIVRCAGCRSNAVKYLCPSCNFSGPN
ncbi:RNA-binding protein [Candidatus Woesearchaeota archaeon]|nr:RNA-binding protein [Candidatus Woesearchaeota archaeon]